MSGVAIEGLAESDGNGTYGLVNVSQADGNHATFRQVTTRLRGYKLFHDGVAWTVTLADDEDTCWAYATSAEKQPWKIRADAWHVYTGKEWAPAPPTFAVREAPGAPHFQPQEPPPEPHPDVNLWLATDLSGCQRCKRCILGLLWVGTWAWVFVSLVQLPSILADEEEYGYGYGYDSAPSAPCGVCPEGFHVCNSCRLHELQAWREQAASEDNLWCDVDSDCYCDTDFCRSMTDPQTSGCAMSAASVGLLANLVETNAPGVGGWGGTCTCPDGEVYQVGDFDNDDYCGSLACIGGVAGSCYRDPRDNPGGAHVKVTCAPGQQSTEDDCDDGEVRSAFPILSVAF